MVERIRSDSLNKEMESVKNLGASGHRSFFVVIVVLFLFVCSFICLDFCFCCWGFLAAIETQFDLTQKTGGEREEPKSTQSFLFPTVKIPLIIHPIILQGQYIDISNSFSDD